MKVEQISIFLENKAGRLADVTAILSDAGININALALADTSEFGILRLIVDQHAAAIKALKEKGFTVGLTNVVAVEISHSPGGLHKILKILDQHGVNVEYMYGFPCRGTAATIVFRFDRTEYAIEILQQNGVHLLTDEEVSLV